jgi:hypothetical protein
VEVEGEYKTGIVRQHSGTRELLLDQNAVGYGFFGMAVSGAGVVAVSANPGPGPGISAYLVVPGGAQIIAPHSEIGGNAFVEDVNDSGEALLWVTPDGLPGSYQALMVAGPNGRTTVFDDALPAVLRFGGSVNNSGTAAYSFGYGMYGVESGRLVVADGGTETTIFNWPIDNVRAGAPRLSDDGSFYFYGSVDDDFGIYRWDNGAVSTVQTQPDGFSTTSLNIKFNRHGDAALLSDFKLLSGFDPVNGAIFTPSFSPFGSPVYEIGGLLLGAIGFEEFDINDRGQVVAAMNVFDRSGFGTLNRAIVVATPIPEPHAITLALVALLATTACGRRSRAPSA